MRKPKESFWKKYDGIISLVLGTILVIIIGVLTFSIISSARQSLQQQEKNAQELQHTLPTTYTVQDGDTLWSIAITFYNSGYNWVSIASASDLQNPDLLAVGQVLTIPDVAPITIEQGDILDGATTDTVKPAHGEVMVAQGDSLWTIAEREYGTGYKWVDIVHANAIITNPDLIYPNTILRLP